MSPQRIQRKRTAGWRMPEGAIYVGRPTRWGNPWRPGEDDPVDPRWLMSRERAVELYERALLHPTHIHHFPHDPWLSAVDVRCELAGHDLACWCPLDAPCHADVLLAMANGGGA